MPKGPAARNTDTHVCTMPMESGTGTHVGGIVTVAGLRTVFINKMLAATMNDICVCPGSPNTITGGSGRVFINGQPAARINDLTAHMGHIQTGSPNVQIGD